MNNNPRQLKLYNWNLEFSRDSSEPSLISFLELLHLKMDACNVTESEILPCISELLTGTTLAWYLAHRRAIESFDDLIYKMENAFLPPEYQTQLLREACASRRQRVD
ncbi:uncharacterized protein LOC113470841 [Diaphorina citri]|uniref:Uncharacterized protein LOC113470841 n=1 Tax=Diaphorina citri TaxID=121845 RepID=A0A3Q0JEE1_DIACI|nr:uncharacterized protein LOC113470841 [Diaphorina citri]